MTDKQSNYYDMFKAVDAIYDANKAAIDTVVARATAFAKHKVNITAIENKAGLSSTNPTGVTQNKRTARETLNNTTYSIIQMVLAYAISISDNALKAEMDYELTDIQKLKDDEISTWAQFRLNLVNPLLASLADYAIDAAAITAWQDAINAHTTIVALPRAAVVARSGHKEDLQNLTEATNNYLRETIDTLMKPIRISDPSLYYNYQHARVIIDRGSSGASGGNGGSGSNTTGTAQGSITSNETSTGIANATLLLKQNGETKYTIQTGGDGNYQKTGIAVGLYDFVFEAQGYKTLTIPGVEITAGETTQQDVVLNLIVTTFSGIARDINTLQPIVGLSVKGYEEGDPANFIEVFTDANGFFSLKVPLTSTTNINLEASSGSYLTEMQTIAAEPDTDYPNLDFNMTPEV